jgi:hypothetical protein
MSSKKKKSGNKKNRKEIIDDIIEKFPSLKNKRDDMENDLIGKKVTTEENKEIVLDKFVHNKKIYFRDEEHNHIYNDKARIVGLIHEDENGICKNVFFKEKIMKDIQLPKLSFM